MSICSVRQAVQVGLIVATCFTCCGCRSRQEAFERLYAQVTTEQQAETMAGQFKKYYPELVMKLDSVQYYKIMCIVAEHGHWYAATHFAPYLDRTEGERRFVLACLVAMFSHGHHHSSMEVVQDASNAVYPSYEGLRNAVLRDLMDNNEQWCKEDALRLGVPVEQWKAMSRDERWKRIVESGLPGRMPNGE